MTLQCVYGATVAVFAFGVVSVGPAYAQRRDGALLPQDQSGEVTAAGCLVRGTSVRGGPKDKYVLAKPKRGPVASVPDSACTASTGDDALTLDNTSAAGINDKMLGRWVEITGRLERETDKNPDNLRELDVASFKMIPVAAPPRPGPPATPPAAAPPATPRPAPAATPPPAAAPAPAPAATPAEPRKTLPKTASPLPAIGFAGLLSLGVGLMLRSLRRRQRG